MRNYDKDKSFFWNLKREIKEDWNNLTKEKVVDTCTMCFYTVGLALSYIYYVFVPVLESTGNYTESQIDPDPIIILALAGFMILGLWFTMTWINFFLSKWTYRLIMRLVK